MRPSGAASSSPPPAGRFAVHGAPSTSSAVHGETGRVASITKIGSGGSDQDQLVADQALILQIAVEGGPGGPAWKELIGHVYDYGRRTLHRFIVDGTLVRRVRDANPNNPDAAKIAAGFMSVTETQHHSERNAVVTEALTSALGYWWRKVIPEGRWDAAKGAQLRTYFVNAALMRLLKPMDRATKRLILEQARAPEAIVARQLAAEVADPDRARSPFDDVVERDAALAALAALDLTVLERDMFELVAEGYSHAEIADRLDLPSTKAVEGRIGRCRRRVRAS